jgi:hypothetical protein
VGELIAVGSANPLSEELYTGSRRVPPGLIAPAQQRQPGEIRLGFSRGLNSRR